MDEFRFVKFAVYGSAKAFLKDIFIVTSQFSEKQNYLTSQINRASLSIVLNIAEGSGKNSDKEFNRYIQHSLGSVHEVYAALDIANDLHIITQQEFERLTEELISIRKQLGGLSKKLKAES